MDFNSKMIKDSINVLPDLSKLFPTNPPVYNKLKDRKFRRRER